MHDQEEGQEIEALLRAEAARPIPPPSPDLIGRTLRRVRNWTLVGDLLRFATFEGLWKSMHPDQGNHSEDEAGSEGRHD